MSISKRLKDLIVAFGGAESAAAIPGTRIDGLLARLTTAVAAKNAGIELPGVSGTDNGKILGVSGGKWSKIAAPGGIYDVPITVTLDGTAVKGATTAHYADVIAAHDAGKLCRAVVDASAVGGDVNYAYPIGQDTTESKYCWSMLEYLGGALTWISFYLDAEDHVSVSTETIETAGG